MKQTASSLYIVLTGALWIVSGSVGANGDLARVQSQLDALYGDGATIAAPSSFSNLYTFHPTKSPREAGLRLITSDLDLIVNDGQNEWVKRSDRSVKDPQAVADLRSQAAPQLPQLGPLLILKKGAPVAMMIYSAVDCGACAVLEKYLSRSAFSYGVFPTALAETRLNFAEEAYCHPSPAKAWTQLMLHRELISAPGKSGCVYPRIPIANVRSVFGSGQTPLIIFADGDVSLGTHSDAEGQKKMTDYIRAKIKRGVVFNTSP